MECWNCEGTAAAMCSFCGRATCREHARTMPTVLTSWTEEGGAPLGLVVEDAVYCGSCRPHPHPIRLDIAMGDAA